MSKDEQHANLLVCQNPEPARAQTNTTAELTMHRREQESSVVRLKPESLIYM